MRCGLISVTWDAGRNGPRRFSKAGFAAVARFSPARTMAFAGPMGTSAGRWGMELEPAGDGQTDAMMWVEVDLAGIMRAIPAGLLKDRIQRVSDVEMVAIKAAVESDAREGAAS
jgi:hypothetical protein